MQQATKQNTATVSTKNRPQRQNKTTTESRRMSTETIPVFPLFICVLMGFLVTLITSLLFGVILSVGSLPLTIAPVFVLLSLFAGAFVCGKACGRAFPKERGFMALICGLSGTIALVLINLFFFREPITALSFVKYTVIVVGCVLGAALQPKTAARKKRRH